MYFLYPRFGSPIELILPRATSLYRGSGFPSLGSKLQVFIIIALDSDFPISSSSSRVVQAGPDALKIGWEKIIFPICISKFFIK